MVKNLNGGGTTLRYERFLKEGGYGCITSGKEEVKVNLLRKRGETNG